MKKEWSTLIKVLWSSLSRAIDQDIEIAAVGILLIVFDAWHRNQGDY